MDEDQNPIDSPETKNEPPMTVNDYGATLDSAVVIEEPTRTVLLTEDETLIIEKEPHIDIVPRNRPRKIYAGMWGPLEIATVGLGMLAILAVIILYVLVVLPAKKELEAHKAERDRVEGELVSARAKYGDITNTETRVAELIQSVDDFETRFLRNPLIDKTSLYQRINGLISAYDLVNTSGPDYAPLEISDNNRQQENEASRGRAKFQSLFPGVYVTTTIEGSYQNLRRFIREIETSDQFIVISAVEFAPAQKDEKSDPTKPSQAQINSAQLSEAYPNGLPINQPPVLQTAPQQVKTVRGKTHGETVSLRLEMAAYFRRPNYQPTEIVNQQQ
ncbi:MAG: hypothetical protein ACR2HG_15640 [Pyrinomonadaceae bacterium]